AQPPGLDRLFIRLPVVGATFVHQCRRILLLVSLCLAALAACEVDRRARGEGSRWPVLAVAAGLAALVVWASPAHPHPPRRDRLARPPQPPRRGSPRGACPPRRPAPGTAERALGARRALAVLRPRRRRAAGGPPAVRSAGAAAPGVSGDAARAFSTGAPWR